MPDYITHQIRKSTTKWIAKGWKLFAVIIAALHLSSFPNVTIAIFDKINFKTILLLILNKLKNGATKGYIQAST